MFLAQFQAGFRLVGVAQSSAAIATVYNLMVLGWATSWVLLLSYEVSPAVAESRHLQQAADHDVDDRLVVRGLIDRQLFDLAESLCHDQLRKQPSGTVGLSDWTIELIKVLAAKASSSDLISRDEQWEQVEQIQIQFARLYSDHPRLILVRLQGALTSLSRAQQIRQEVQIEMREAADALLAVENLETVARELQALERHIDSMIPIAPDQPQNDGRLSKHELQNLKINIALQLARSNVDRALLLPSARSFDRLDILRQADSQLESVLRATNPDQPLWWEVQLELAKIKRHQGDLATARQTLDAIQIADPPVELNLLVEEESMRLLIAVGNLEAIQQILRSIEPDKRRRPGYSVLLVEAALQVAEGIDDEQQRSYWQQMAMAFAKRIEIQHGAYWTRQANLLLTKSFGSGIAQIGDAQILLRVAMDSERKQHWEEAIQAYDKAADAFLQVHQTEQATQIRYRAALILQQQQQHRHAYERFNAVVEDFPDSKTAASANVLAIWNYSRLPDGQPDRNDRYRQMLDRHLSTWPDHESAAQILLWRAETHALKQDFQDAYNDLMMIFSEQPQTAEAIKLAQQWLEPATQAFEEDATAQREFVLELSGWLESHISDEPNQMPESWNAAKQQAAVLLARVNLLFLGESEVWLGTLLRAALSQPTGPDEPWRSFAAAWLVVALVSQPDTDEEIASWLTRIAEAEAWTQLLSGIDAVLNRTSETAVQKMIARRHVLISSSLEQQLERVDDAQKMRWSLAKARSLELGGDYGQAISELEQLALDYPQEVAVHVAYAAALTRSEVKADWAKALGRWRLIAAKTQPNSVRWFEAKYHVAKLLLKTGQHQEAAQFLEFMERVPPGWTESALKSEFDQLLREAKRQR